MRQLLDYYGDLKTNPEARTEFIRDARDMLNDIGEKLHEMGVIHSWNTKRWLGRGNYAGEVFALYAPVEGDKGVMIGLTHKQGEIMTRPDGIAGVAQYRKITGMYDGRPRFEIRSSRIERLVLRSFTAWGVLGQIKGMLLEG